MDGERLAHMAVTAPVLTVVAFFVQNSSSPHCAKGYLLMQIILTA